MNESIRKSVILVSVALGALEIGLGSLPAQDEYRAKAFAASDAGDLPRAAELFYRLVRAGATDKSFAGRCPRRAHARSNCRCGKRPTRSGHSR